MIRGTEDVNLDKKQKGENNLNFFEKRPSKSQKILEILLNI